MEDPSGRGDQPLMMETDPFPQLTLKTVDPDAQDAQGDVLAGIRYARFSIGSIPGMKHAVFIPDNLQLTSEVLEHVCLAIGEEPPTMLLQGVGSSCHPGSMTTPELRACGGFEHLIREAKHSLSTDAGSGEYSLGNILDSIRPANARGARAAAGCWCGSLEVAAEEGQANVSGSTAGDDAENQALQEFANKVLEKKLTNTAASIAKAAAQSNVWIMVSPLITPLEVCLLRSQENGDDNAYTVACVHMQDRAYMESKHAKELLRQLFSASEAMSAGTVEEFVPAALPGDLWTPAKNGMNKQFHDHGFDHWSWQRATDKEAAGHPLVVFPWPGADLLFFFYRVDADSHGILPEADWSYQTAQRHDTEAVPWQPENLAPLSYVFIGAEPRSKQKVIQMLQNSKPLIFIDNTPSVAKQMSLFMSIMKKVVGERLHKSAFKNFLQDGMMNTLPAVPKAAQALAALSPSKILKYIEKEYDDKTIPLSLRLSLSDVVGILDFAKQRPHVFRDRITILNPLVDDVETVFSELSQTFCASYSSATDDPKGLAVSKNLVLKGWRLHSKLRQSSTHLRFLATALTTVVSLLMFGCTALAVLIVNIKLQKNRIQEELLSGYKPEDDSHGSMHLTSMGEAFNFWILMLPISAGLLMTMQSHFQFAEKWAGAHLAEQQVVSEIYQFLGNCGRYTGGGATSRANLLKRLQAIVTNVSSPGLRDKDFLSIDDSDAFASDSQALSIHINRSLYGMEPQSWLRRTCHETLQGFGLASVETDGPLERDPTLPVTTEVYMETRVIPLMKYYDSCAKAYARLRTVIVLAVFTLLGSGFFLTAFGYLLWIPITVSLATLLTTLMHWMAPMESITALGSAISALHNLDLRWHGSSTKEQRSEAMHKRIISVTEKVALAVGTALSQAPLSQEDLSMEEDYETQTMSFDAEVRFSSKKMTEIQSRMTPRGGRTSGRSTPVTNRTPRLQY
jgi:membrane protein implicated in regulation of membrane protease activity